MALNGFGLVLSGKQCDVLELHRAESLGSVGELFGSPKRCCGITESRKETFSYGKAKQYTVQALSGAASLCRVSA